MELNMFKRQKEYLEQQTLALQEELMKKSNDERIFRSETTQKIAQLELKSTEALSELEGKSKQVQLLKVSWRFSIFLIRL